MRKAIASIITLFSTLAASAVPANPKPFVHTQPDGTRIILTLVGDEYSHAYLDEQGRTVEVGEDGFVRIICENGIERVAQRRCAALKDRRMKEKGTAKRICRQATASGARGLIILANFDDLKFSNTREAISEQMNTEGYDKNGATGSARDYFTAQSSGAFQPTFDVVGPIDLEMPYRYYGGNDANGDDRHADTMIFSAVQKAAEAGLDLNLYDADQDGILDMVYVIYAGKGEADGGDANTVWPHMWNLQASAQFAYQEINGKRVGLYACSAECRRDGTYSGIGTFCHEYGHCLGLPDIYDVTYGGGYGMASYDVMSSGSYLNNGNTPPNYSGFERYSVGWMNYDDITMSRDVTLLPINESNTAIRLSSKSNPNEYFVLENRQHEGWDAYLPARGLMITHIDYDEQIWDNNAVNADKDHQHVKMMAADNIWNSSTQSGDLYPGLMNNTAFTDSSTPNSNLWDGTPLGKPVTDIKMSGNEVSFRVDIDATGIRPTLFRVNGDDIYCSGETRLYGINGNAVNQGYKGIVIGNGMKWSR